MKRSFEQRKILPFVNKPGRYLGLEHNSTTKQWENNSLRCALVFPDLYEIGMSHQGLQILYHILNSQEDILAERCYCPDLDMEHELRAKNLPLCSIESGHSLLDFDLLGITLPYELCYTNILTILDLASIPLRSKDRTDTMPIILGGGSCGLNPEPISDFFDAILLGDGEEAIFEIAQCLKQCKTAKHTRHETLEQLSQIHGIYIPSFYNFSYEGNRLAEIHVIEQDLPPVQRRIVADLSTIDHLLHPLVPNSKIVHDRLGVEIARGCTRGCRFCQAGIIYRPVRERTTEQIFDLAQKGIENSGFDELALLSLSTGDYSCLSTVLPQLMDQFAKEAISVSMPSMRVGTLTQDVMDQIKRVRKTGFTLAPEAGSERLRRVINKGITEDDLMTTCRDAFTLGWKVMKLYFMIGLPGETMEDIDAIVELAKKTKKVGNEVSNGRLQINVSIGTFVPKPHTPFQWEEQISMEESREKIDYLKKTMPRKGIKLKWHDPEMSFLEGVFSRGDRRLGDLLETVWRNGSRLDAWSEHFSLSRWQQAAEECGLDLNTFLRKRDQEELLPWQHLNSGVDTSFLKNELAKSIEESYTPDCRYHSCQKCGLCDFKTIMPIVQDRKKELKPPATCSSTNVSHKQEGRQTTAEGTHFRYTVTYSRLGDICYLGHLEILQLIFRCLRRAKIRTNFSKGFNPSPKISFGPALPVGTQSHAEFFVMDLPALLPDQLETCNKLNQQLPEGLKIIQISPSEAGLPQQLLSSYDIILDPPLQGDDIDKIKLFLSEEHFTITRTRKRKTKEIDIRPLISALTVQGKDTIHLDLISRASEAGAKPLEAIAAILQRDQSALLSSKVIKTKWKSLT